MSLVVWYASVAVLQAALGIWVLLAQPRKALNWAVAALLLFWAGSGIAFQLMRETTTFEAHALYNRIGSLYEAPAAFLVLLIAERLFLAQPAPPWRKVAIAFAGVGTVALFLGLATLSTEQDMAVASDGLVYANPSSLTAAAAVLVFGAEAVAVLLASRVALAPDRGALPRRQAAMVGLAFVFLLGHGGGGAWSQLLTTGYPFRGEVLVRVPPILATLLAFLVVLVSVPRLARAYEGRARRAYLALCALPVLVGSVQALVPDPFGPFGTRVLWVSGFALALAVAILRYDLGGLGEASRRRAAGMAQAMLSLVPAVMAAGAALALLGTTPVGWAAVGVAVAAPVGLQLKPFRSLSVALQRRVLLDPGDRHVVRERVRAYTAALRSSAGPDGRVPSEAEAALRALRAELGLTDRDHAMLLSAMADQTDRGGLVAYRLALEATQREGGPADAPDLQRLRTELGVSEKEHEVLRASLRGTGAGPMEPGALLLGRYRVVRLLGRGGFGEAFLARDLRQERDVVLKRLLGEQRRSAAALRRFQKEVRLAGAIAHPNIVAVHDVELAGDEAFLVMEFVEGGSVADRLGEGPLPEPEAVRLGLDVLAALGALHARGIVHRDVKPSNILLDAHGRAKLGDFTIARELISGETAGGSGGAPLGTPAYMAPEQVRNLPASPATDLYGLAASLYEAVGGAPPLRVAGLSVYEASLLIVQDAPALPVPNASPALSAVLERALRKDPADRYPDAAGMAAALRAASERPTRAGTPAGSAPRRPRRPA